MDSKLKNQKAKCQQMSEALSAHFDGVANEAEHQLAKTHLADCPSCARMLQEWQGLRLMEQRALEPSPDSDMIPFAPVVVPRHLKSAILRKTVGSAQPIWQRFWPRLLTGMAVPTFAIGCWLLVVAAPWQQSATEISTQPNVVPQEQADTGSEISSNTPALPKMTQQKAPVIIANKTEKSVPELSSKKVLSSANSQREVVTKVRQSARPASNNITNRSAKSTFSNGNSQTKSIVVKTPQISMASFERPRSRAAKSVVQETPKPISATAPQRIAEIPSNNMTTVAQVNDVSSNPVSDYIAANDVRPDSIKQAVENYRAALIDDGEDF